MKKISKLNGLILIGVFLVLMYMIYNLNILPFRYFLIIGGILLLFVLLFVFKLVRDKTGFISRILFNILSIVFIAGQIYLMTYINATKDFMNSLVAKNFEEVTYDVVVNSNGSMDHMGDLYNKEVGYLESDKNYKLVKFKIRQDVKYKEKKYKEVDNFVEDITMGNVNGVIVEDSYYSLLKEEDADLSLNTKIIKQYKIIVKKGNKKKVKSTSTEPFLIYISGIDTYGQISSVSRSDVNILAAINPKTGKILLVSIPRDYYVQLHNTTGIKDKLTHAGIYGIDTSMETINDLLDTKIDYFIRLNFSTLTKSIDLIDGVDVYSDKDLQLGKIKINQGMNHMDGETALAFARERKSYATGDRHRGENQQAIITAMIKKMTSKEYITKYKDILTSLEGTFETSMTYDEMTDIFKMQISKRIDWQIESISLDGTGSMQPTYSMGSRNLYVMVPDEATVNNAKDKLNEYLEEK